MKAVAKRNYIRMSPRKLRLVADLIRGEKLSAVLPQLAFLHQEAADPMLKVVKQAAANARQLGASGDLTITKVLVDQGPILKRWQPVSRGRAHSIKKYTSHILIEVEPVINMSANKPANTVKKASKGTTLEKEVPTQKTETEAKTNSTKKTGTSESKKPSKVAAKPVTKKSTPKKASNKQAKQPKSSRQ